MDLREHFLRLASSHGADAQIAERWWRELEARYSAPDRHYHTLEHIAEMLGLLPHAPETVLAAVWFHDAVYGGRANEERSAELARAALSELRFPAYAIEVVEQLILATKRHDPSEVAPQFRAFLDADLAILGSERPRYHRYVQQVREEYSQFPEPFFRGARNAILDGILERPRIYATDEFFARFEERARENIQWEIAMSSRA
ncbi:MAG TPA: metal-dependent phosphohydrolase [Thermoanaerobaculia bacterium]|nr:metal-dependent phosphohydrolase [Thermoanaerobaculia bacterium]